MIRIIIAVSVLLLATSSLAIAEGQEHSLLNLGYKHQQMQRVDINMSVQAYEKTYRRNRKIMSNSLEDYSKATLGLIGIPEQGINLMGTALGVVINGARLNLNESKTLGLELKNVGNSGRTLYFGVNLSW